MKTPLKSVDASGAGIGRSVSLPVLDRSESRAPVMGRTKKARWRAAVLALVNVLMIVHLIQWAIVGMTVSPIEPSEAMQTLEVGVVNAGAIFFLLAILSTLIFGRFFCGWLCHVLALQDLCVWMMTRVGIRPKPFRSRFLIYFPILLGAYMFVWPTFKREALAPVLSWAEIDWPHWLRPVEPILVWSNGLVTENFWETMPPWYIAVPFLFICGFACVYFLGAKGFCTYGCPYAAFFKPIDKLSPMRIRVNDDCKQCGYCTSVCTSNVRVSEEVRDFGMVVDPGCMKTLDCVSTCPNDALSVGFGRPSLGAKTKADAKETRKAALEKRRGRYDLLMWEEVLAAALILWFFFATRGMLDAVPMLLAGGLAAIATLIVMMAIKLIHERHVRLYKYQFKKGGVVQPGGYLLVLVALGFVVGSAWSGNARLLRWQGDLRYNSASIPTSVLLRPEFNPTPAQLSHAQGAVEAYQRADSPKLGGVGWRLNAEHRLRLSYFLSVMDRHDEALAQLREVITDGEPTDALVLQAGQVLIRAMDDNPTTDQTADHENSKRAALIKLYQDALEAHPNLHAIRSELARSALSISEMERADAFWQIERYQDDPMFTTAYASYEGAKGDIPRARELFELAAEQAVKSQHPPGMWIDIARSALPLGMRDLPLELAQRAIDHKLATALTWLAAGEIANSLGRGELGVQRAEQALTMPGVNQPMVKARAAGVLLGPDTIERGRQLLREAAADSTDPFERFAIARGMVFAGNGLNVPEMMDEGITLLEQVAGEHPEFPVIAHDLSTLLYQMGRTPDALDWMVKAAEWDQRSELLAQRVSQMYDAVGDSEQAERWLDEAQRRRDE